MKNSHFLNFSNLYIGLKKSYLLARKNFYSKTTNWTPQETFPILSSFMLHKRSRKNRSSKNSFSYVIVGRHETLQCINHRKNQFQDIRDTKLEVYRGFQQRGIDWKHYFQRLVGSTAQKLRIFFDFFVTKTLHLQEKSIFWL